LRLLTRFALVLFADVLLVLAVEAFREPVRFADDRLAVVFREVVFPDDGRFVPAFLVLERFALDRLVVDDFRFGAFRPPAFAAFFLIFSETSSACSTAIVSILSATVRTRSCAASVESSFLPAFTAVSFTPSFAMGSVLPLSLAGTP
jgi:hypothetical protein